MRRHSRDSDDRIERLRRLAVVYANELRKQMATELLMRDMSPTEFHGQFGGGSVPRVDRHVQALVGGGWTTLVEKKSGGRRRGATEHFYRATEPAAIDTPTNEELPYSIRAAICQGTFQELAGLMRTALVSGTFDARADRHLSWTPLLLDLPGWKRVIAAVDSLFESLQGDQADARQRLAESGEDPFLMTVGLAAFESPGDPEAPEFKWMGPDLVEGGESSGSRYLRLSKLIEDEVCLLIVDELNRRPMSVPQFHREFGEELDLSRHAVRSRFKRLVDLGWLAKVGVAREEGRRGPPEHVYGATRPAVFGAEDWAEVPKGVRSTQSWRTVDNLVKQARMAMEAGTFTARPDAHLTWSPLRVDRQGWEGIVAKVDEVFAYTSEEQERAKQRLAESGEQPIRMTVALAAFESPQDGEKQP